MLTPPLTEKIFFINNAHEYDTLCILSAYASPNMASWLIKSLSEKKLPPVKINLILGMTPYDGISLASHESFKLLHTKRFDGMSKFSCSYLTDIPPNHSNLYIWLKNNSPKKAFTGSAEFTQWSFLSGWQEIMTECDPQKAFSCYQNIESKSAYCNYDEIESSIRIEKEHFIDYDSAESIIFNGKEY